MVEVIRRGPRAPVQRLASLKDRNTRLQSRTPGPSPSPTPTPEPTPAPVPAAAPAEKRKKASKSRCPECQSTEIRDVDGISVCGECGVTVNDSNIVAEVAFAENKAGAAIVQGGFVGEGQRHARTTAPGRYIHETREPREVSESNGKDEIKRQANRNNLSENVSDQAVSIYRLALNYNFIQGRQIRVVAAICLYAACRRDPKNQTLLMDLAEGISVNVFKLGQVWSDLKKNLYLEELRHVPVVEVENLIMKFARKLEFGTAVYKVAEDATKLLKRMKRDWMVSGRQPAGLCGACIILAARMNNFRRTVREVVYVVKVADVTLTKRLEEFGRLESSNLTVEQFRKHGLRLKNTHEPPIVYERAERERKKRSLEGLGAEASQDDPEVISDDDEDDTSAHRSKRTRGEPRLDSDGFAIPDIPVKPSRGRTLKRSHERTDPDESEVHSDDNNTGSSIRRSKRVRRVPRLDADGFAIPDIPVKPSSVGEKKKRRHEEADAGSSLDEPNSDDNTGSSVRRSKRVRRGPRLDADGFAIPYIPANRKDGGASTSRNASSDSSAVRGAKAFSTKKQKQNLDGSSAAQGAETTNTEDPVPKRSRKPKRTPQPVRQISEEELMAEAELEMEMESILMDPTSHITIVDESAQQTDFEGAESRAKVAADSLRSSENPTRGPVSDDPEIADDEFDDDPEIADMLLSEADIKVKETLWVAENEDWLREQQEKKLKIELDAASGVVKAAKKARKKGRLGDGSILEGGAPVTSAADAAKRMLEKHGSNPSKHINYDNFHRLYAELTTTSSTGSESATRASSMAASEASETSETSDTSSFAAAGAGEGVRRSTSRSSASATPARRRRLPSNQPSSSVAARSMDAAQKDQSADEGSEEESQAETEAEDDEDDEEDEDDEDDETEVGDNPQDRIRAVAKSFGIDMGDDEYPDDDMESAFGEEMD